MQRAADQAINAHTPPNLQGALVSLDRDGAIRAMIGGKDYVASLYNRATQATRQPGSSFKLFVYLAALEAGYQPAQTVVDSPVNIGGWRPRNNDRTFRGSITLRQAFAQSINTISAKLGEEVGFGTIADMARRFGITTEVNTHPSMVLGTSDVRLLDMTRAFAAVSRKGVAVTPYGIRRVTTAKGEVLYEHQADESRVLVAPWVAAQMTDLLQAAVLTGTGRAAQIGRPVAGKTGTTSSNKDGWFIGFSSGITTGVWMGRDNARPNPGLQGGRAPAQAFHAFMVQAVARRPVEPFEITVEQPEWQLEPDDEAYFGEPEAGMQVDADGNPIVPADPAYGAPFPDAPAPLPGKPPPARDQARPRLDDPQLDQEWIDNATGRNRPTRRESEEPVEEETPQPLP
jgi:penicillin-binding protein 1A